MLLLLLSLMLDLGPVFDRILLLLPCLMLAFPGPLTARSATEWGPPSHRSVVRAHSSSRGCAKTGSEMGKASRRLSYFPKKIAFLWIKIKKKKTNFFIFLVHVCKINEAKSLLFPCLYWLLGTQLRAESTQLCGSWLETTDAEQLRQDHGHHPHFRLSEIPRN